MAGGFTRRLLELVGPRTGGRLFVDAGIEWRGFGAPE